MRRSGRSEETRRVSGQPRPVRRQVYEEVQEAAVRRLSICRTVRAVFRMGSIGEPGISDLDLIIVAAGDVAPSDLPEIRNVHPSAEYVMMHTPFLVDEATFAHIRQLAGISHLKRLAGETPLPRDDKVPDLLRLHLAAKYALDGVFFACRQESVGALSVRSTLCSLNTMHHLLNLVREQIQVPPAAVVLAREIRDLRANWFEDPDIDRLWALVSDAVPAYLAILDAVGEASPGLGVPGIRALSWLNMEVTVAQEPFASLSVKTPLTVRILDAIPGALRPSDDLRWFLRTCRVEIALRTGWVLSAGNESEPPEAIRHRAELLGHYKAWLGKAANSFAMLCPRVDACEPSEGKWHALSVCRRVL